MQRNKRLKNNTSELHQLKTLLLSDELEQLKKLESKLKSLEFEAYDEATISQKLLPLFDDILLQKLQEKESRTIELLSRHLAQIILQSSQKDLPALSRSLQSVISPAISKEIEQNKDKMVDALYPIMGGMISKYVTQAIKEMMDNINEKIEDGLSFDRYKRKLKSKVSGVSETELLLEESSDAVISSLFVIHKESGLLIAEAHLEDQEIDDPHMVASMASAIKDFVNDWIKNHEDAKSSEVQIVSYGNETLYIESAGSVYIIAFLDSEPDHEQRSCINEFFAKLVKSYSTFFQHFDGDDSSKEVKEISQKMHTFLHTQTNSKKIKNPKSVKKGNRKNPVRTVLIVLGILFLGYLLYLGDQYYSLYRLEKRIFEKTDQNVHIKRINDKLHVLGNISSMNDFYAIKNIIFKETSENFVNELHMPLEEVDKRLLKQNKVIEQFEDNLLKQNKEIIKFEGDLSDQATVFQKKIDLLEKKLNRFTFRYDKLQNQLGKIENTTQVKAYILEKLAYVFNNSDAFHKEDGSLDFKNRKLFEVGKTLPREESLKLLKENFKQYIEILMGNEKIAPFIKEIVIEGYTDSSGNDAFNKKLSEQRAWKIKEYLDGLDVSKRFHLHKILKAKGLANENPIIVNGVEDQEASRRIKIKFEIDQGKILNTIKKTIND